MKNSVGSFAFVKIGHFSGTNDHVLEHLRRQFLDLEADVIDVSDFKVLGRSNAAQLLYSVAREYGLTSCLTKSHFRSRAIRTVYFFSKVRDRLLQRLSQRPYAFTFQTQSLFDASIPETPHFVYTDHAHLANLTYPGRGQVPMASAAWIELEKSIYKNARLNFTMSSHVSRSLLEQYGCSATRMQCVYAGSNATTIDPEMGFERFAQKRILFVGIDWDRKGGPVLLKAFREVRRAHPTAELIIVGCRPDVSMEGCRVVGQVSSAEVAKFYRSASVFCLPTTVEPFGIVFVEAFAHGLPIVATNIGALPDFVEEGESGYLVRCNDPAQLASRLIDLLANPARCIQFGARGQAMVSDRYTWQATAEKLATHIRRCVPLDSRVVPVRKQRPLPEAHLDPSVAL